MTNDEVLNTIEILHREKGIEKEIIFKGIESAIVSAIRRKYINFYDFTVHIDRSTGDIDITSQDVAISPPDDLGRIAAQAGKQTILQKIREAQSDMLYEEFKNKKWNIVTGEVNRYENKDIIVIVSNTEAILPQKEQILGEYYRQGDGIRAYLLDVSRQGSKINIVLSRSHPYFVRKLFELEIPEIAQGIIQIHALVREPGQRTKIAVSSQDPKVDCIGSCIGIRGTRIRHISDELRGEKIDIIRWEESLVNLIRNALQPAQVGEIEIDTDLKKAKVIVPSDEDQRKAIGKDGLNVRLAARLCCCDIDIVQKK